MGRAVEWCPWVRGLLRVLCVDDGECLSEKAPADQYTELVLNLVTTPGAESVPGLVASCLPPAGTWRPHLVLCDRPRAAPDDPVRTLYEPCAYLGRPI